MSEKIQIGDPPISIVIRHSKAAKKYNLRLSHRDAQIALTIPRFGTISEGVRFAQSQNDWLQKHARVLDEAPSLRYGAWVELDGIPREIRHAKARALSVGETHIALNAADHQVGKKIAAYFKAIAKLRFASLSSSYAERIDKKYEKISIRDTKSRWGSCGANGRLMYSWRLMMAPPEIQAYVAAHEVSHLIHMNHSPDFWAQVAELYPDFAKAKAWLKANGAALQSRRF